MTKQDYETLAAFRYELRRFHRFSEQAAIKNGLPPQQYQALLAIEGFPGRDRVTVSELAEKLQIETHSAVGLADRLQSAKLIKRETSNEDRRCVYISLTTRGRTNLRKLAAFHRKELRTVGPLLMRLLERVNQII